MAIKLYLRTEYPRNDNESDTDYCKRVIIDSDKTKNTWNSFKNIAVNFHTQDKFGDMMTPFGMSNQRLSDLNMLHKKSPDDSTEEYLKKTIFWIDSELSVLELVREYISSEYDKQQKV